jgi:hypothetical protein
MPSIDQTLVRRPRKRKREVRGTLQDWTLPLTLALAVDGFSAAATRSQAGVHRRQHVLRGTPLRRKTPPRCVP